MSRDDIIRMAVEAGCSAGMRASLILGQERDLEWLRRFANLAAAYAFAKRAPSIVISTTDIDPELLRDMLAKAKPGPIVAMPPAPDVAAAVAAEREACAQVCDAKAARWRKEAQRHLPRYRSDQAERDLARAAICESDAAAIRARGTP